MTDRRATFQLPWISHSDDSEAAFRGVPAYLDTQSSQSISVLGDPAVGFAGRDSIRMSFGARYDLELFPIPAVEVCHEPFCILRPSGGRIKVGREIGGTAWCAICTLWSGRWFWSRRDLRSVARNGGFGMR